MPSPLLQADQLLLKNGSVIIGTLVSAESDVVVFSTPFAGEITVLQKNILRISTEEAVTVMMKDGTIYRERQIISTEDAMQVKAEGEQSVVFKAEDIEMVNPEPWKLGEGYRWKGYARLGVELERGNTDTDDWVFAASSVWRSLTDRYTLEGDIENETKNGSRTENNWTLLTKYDRFFKGSIENYWGIKSVFESDAFADLDLRTTLGPYLGRLFFEKKHFTLQAEVGPVYVNEQFKQADAENWSGLSWIIKAESDRLGHGSTLYLNHDGNQNLQDSENLILNTQIGLSFPLIYGFETFFQIEYEYDGGAVEGVKNLDTTYDWNIGYTW
ncbi:MAG: DUF481 domain-containing protein [Coraliomargaritaceae bacterium]